MLAFGSATVLMLVLRSPALPVFIVGVVAQGLEILVLRRVGVAESLKVRDDVAVEDSFCCEAVGETVLGELDEDVAEAVGVCVWPVFVSGP